MRAIKLSDSDTDTGSAYDSAAYDLAALEADAEK